MKLVACSVLWTKNNQTSLSTTCYLVEPEPGKTVEEYCRSAAYKDLRAKHGRDIKIKRVGLFAIPEKAIAHAFFDMQRRAQPVVKIDESAAKLPVETGETYGVSDSVADESQVSQN